LNSLSSIALPGTLRFYESQGGRLLANYSFDQPFQVTGEQASLKIPQSDQLRLDGPLWIEVCDARGEVLGKGPTTDPMSAGFVTEFARVLIERCNAE
jgi:hypothetical protein